MRKLFAGYKYLVRSFSVSEQRTCYLSGRTTCNPSARTKCYPSPRQLREGTRDLSEGLRAGRHSRCQVPFARELRSRSSFICVLRGSHAGRLCAEPATKRRLLSRFVQRVTWSF